MNITIFTPTYNRKQTLSKLYISLINQTNQSFNWLIIDDGSIDATEDLVQEWINEDKIKIKYIKQQNAGKARCINKAVTLIEDGYVFFVDSDDWLTNDAIESAYLWVESIDQNPNIAGVNGIRSNANGVPFEPIKLQKGEYIDITNFERRKYGLNGDMAHIIKISILKNHPLFIHENESFVPEYFFDEMSQKGLKFRYYNKIIYLSEYLDDGLTKNWKEVFYKNPISNIYALNTKLNNKEPLLYKMKYAIQIGSLITHSKKWNLLNKVNKKTLIFLTFPISYLLHNIKKLK